MKFFATLSVAASCLATVLAQLQIATPASLIECQPAQLTFSGGTAPYYVSVIPGGQTTAAALVDLGQLASSPYTWTVNLASGTSVTLRIIDSAGAPAYSSPITIQAGSSSACLTAAVSSATVLSTTSVNSAAASSALTTAASASSVATTGSAATSAASVASSVSSAQSSAVAATTVATTSKASSAASSAASTSSVGVVSSVVSSVVGAASSAVSSAAAAATSTTSGASKVMVGSGAMVMGAVAAVVAWF